MTTGILWTEKSHYDNKKILNQVKVELQENVIN